jgi:hypothetical protein
MVQFMRWVRRGLLALAVAAIIAVLGFMLLVALAPGL